jgi:hypothetical protein
MRSSQDERVQIAAAQVLLDRGYGKPALAITAPNGGPLVNINVGSQASPNLQGLDPATVYSWMIQGIVPPDPSVFRPPAIEAQPPEPSEPAEGKEGEST